MNEEQELTWAKMQGDWTNANYRRQVAEKGMCLSILVHDINRGVSGEASRRYVDKVLADIRNGDE